jgi:predicted DNA-binding transcriptional regulator AlpA
VSAVRTRLGIADVERTAGISRVTVWRWCRAGKLPAPHYIGDRRMWWADEVEAALAAMTKPAVSSQRLENLQPPAGGP